MILEFLNLISKQCFTNCISRITIYKEYKNMSAFIIIAINDTAVTMEAYLMYCRYIKNTDQLQSILRLRFICFVLRF